MLIGFFFAFLHSWCCVLITARPVCGEVTGVPGLCIWDLLSPGVLPYLGSEAAYAAWTEAENKVRSHESQNADKDIKMKNLSV